MTQIDTLQSTSTDSEEELSVFIAQRFEATDNVVFDRRQAQEITEFKRGIISVWWGDEAQQVPQSGMMPTARARDCFADIRAKDRRTANLIFEELKLALRDYQPRFIRLCGIDRQPLVNENLETDGVRATIMCRYVS